MATPVTRARSLALYRKLMRSCRTWPGPQEEKDWIRSEARSTFQRDRGLTDEDQINKQLFEGESRYDIAWHYKIPYPRLHNLPTGTVKGSRASKTILPAAEVPQFEDDEEVDGLAARAGRSRRK
eukprot:TRINITY_DN14315_c0_g1_i1.p1 TRINITY_DN14315_c0_g1~~TRINITY_DN14315_c0_g1_i1.p1  ORF type:complete len:124 (+),score=11.48 TRINITY_DN14315_c0_g1_i1:61-432(+)